MNSGYYEEHAMTFLKHLTRIAGRLGHKIKEDESWVSRRVFVFLKEIIVDGVILPSCIKRAARVMADTNDAANTLDNQVSSQAAGAQSMAIKGLSWSIPLALALMENCRTILNSLKKGRA